MRCLNGFLSINVVSVGLGLAPGSGLARGAYVACSNVLSGNWCMHGARTYTQH